MGAACAGGGDGDDDGAPVSAPATDRFDALDDVEPGEGSAIIGIEELTFAVTACADGSAPDDPPEAKRTTAGVDGAGLDLTDPDATEPLIDRRGDALDVRATFGPEQARAGDEGPVDGRLRARCPAS
ncbi:hypothetical protein [Iamia sp.]|uniref:hypothetical protein n=1 Tax=Iamia sp. TaxID=2722710 RepID=UPI002BDDF6F5|nr:hypothetical protein [Iamia sp.]HXH56375.1 hypothetical protein [Iamia sp.]